MSLYKYVTIDTLKKILAGGIRFTQPGAFNDPFEMVPELNVPETFTESQINIRFDLLGERRVPAVGELSIDFESDRCSDSDSRSILSELNKSIGILCLSENSDSLLMWSHYADQYAGAIIEFNDSHEFFAGKIKVEYKNHRPKKDISTYLSNGEPIPIAELCTKPECWHYENEVRIIRSLSDCKIVSSEGEFPIYIMQIPIECIMSINLGERTSIPHQRDIWEIVKSTNISLFLSAISNWGYEFRPEIIKFNEPYPKMNPIISPRTAHIFKDYAGDLGQLARWAIEEHPHSELVNKTL